MVIDAVAKQGLHFGDQPLADGPGPAAEHPEERALDDAHREGGAGELLGVGAQLEPERKGQRHAHRDDNQIQLDVRGDVGLQAAPALA